MSQIYTRHRKLTGRAASEKTASPAHSQTVPNSTNLSLMGADHSGSDSLGNSIAQRLPQVQQRVQPQIPQAESEADRLSASVTSGSPEAVKSAMGRRLGADFSGVRFHTGADAAAKANAVEARAYTSGADIYFGEGGFDPAVAAHELVHTAQQGIVASSVPTVSTPVGGVQREGLKLKNKRAYKSDSSYQEIQRILATYQAATDPAQRKNLREGLLMSGRDYINASRASDKHKHEGRQQEIQKMMAQLKSEATAMEGDRSHLSALYGDKVFYEQELLPHVAGQLGQNLSGAAIPVPDAATQKYNPQDVQQLAYALAPTPATTLDPVARDALYHNKISGQDLPQGLREALDDEMNHRAIARSMYMPSSAERSKLTYEEAVNAMQSGRDMAHIMLSMQLGQIGIHDASGGSSSYGAGKAYDPSMASLLSYGGRVNFNFGTSSGDRNANDVYRAMMELDGGQDSDAQITAQARATKTSRPFATHKLKVEKEGPLKKILHKISHTPPKEPVLEEKHGSGAAVNALFDREFKHRGFNPAIGGAGRIGYRADDTASPETVTRDGHVIKPDGTNGHVYLGIHSSSKDTPGGMMVGLETSAAGKKNLMGKAHDAKAARAPFSPTGAVKTGRHGAEYGGRTVDMTGLKMDENVQLHQMFTARLHSMMQAAALNPAIQAQYNQMMYQLSGSQMDPVALQQILVDPNASQEQKDKVLAMIRRSRGL